jgi:hypothetical protein
MRIKGQVPHLAVLAFGFVVSLLVYSRVFGPYLTWDGEPTSARILTLFLLPLTASTIYFLIGSLRSPRRSAPSDPAANAAIDSIVLSILLFLISVHVIVLAVLLRVEAVEFWASRGVVVLVGVTLIAVGNLLPRTRPNFALGIRTSRTLVDRQLWMQTHRVGGYLAVAVGTITIISGLFLSGTQVAALPGIAFLIGAGILAVSYWKFTHITTNTTQV